MRTKISNLPNRYTMIIDVSPKNAITIKVQKLEAELVLSERLKLPAPASILVKTTKEKLIVKFVLDDSSSEWGDIKIDFKSGEILFSHDGKEHWFILA